MKTLLIPYICFSVIDGLVYYTIVELNNISSIKWEMILYAILGMRCREYFIFNATCWFLTTLFAGEVCLRIILQIKNTIFQKLIIFSLIFIGIIYNKYFSWVLPFNIDIVPMILPFLYYGYVFRVFNNREKIETRLMKIIYRKRADRSNIARMRNRWMVIGGGCIAAVAIVGSYVLAIKHNNYVNIYYSVFGNYILFYFNAMSGIILMGIFVKTLIHFKVFKILLSQIGTNSIVIFTLHQTAIMYVLDHLKLLNRGHVWEGVLRIFLCIVILLPLSYLINKYCKWMLGK